LALLGSESAGLTSDRWRCGSIVTGFLNGYKTIATFDYRWKKIATIE
jgi:hypothetical protein